MKTAGVIAGLGPQATASYYTRVQALVQAGGATAHPSMLLWSVPLPYELEASAITTGKGLEAILPYLLAAARGLERAGADFVVMPCNTLHLLAGDIRAGITVPFISITDEVPRVLREGGIKRMTLLGTEATIKQKLYQLPLAQAGIEVIQPDDAQQQRLNSIIIDVIHERNYRQNTSDLRNILRALQARGAETALLACTELHLIAGPHPPIPTIDTMELLAQATARTLLAG